jgi:arylsulfatase A
VRRPHPLYWQYDFAISRPWEIALRDGPWKLLANKSLDRFELYNVGEDIGESRNVAEAQPDRVERMAGVMKQLHADIKRESSRTAAKP